MSRPQVFHVHAAAVLLALALVACQDEAAGPAAPAQASPPSVRCILTRWATERAAIFSITLARWISTVRSLKPRSMAITLFALPSTT